MILIGLIIGMLIGIPAGMIYEDATDTIKLRDKRREDEQNK